MKKLTNGLFAAALAASFALSAAIPANAAMFGQRQTPSVSSDVQTVAWKKWRHNNGNMRHFRGGRMGNHNSNSSYWNGHRGYRTYHRGYRRHGDFWFPLAAFATGALVTGALVNDHPRYGGSHVERCYARYRSYRASDNTFQPYNGPRQQCLE